MTTQTRLSICLGALALSFTLVLPAQAARLLETGGSDVADRIGLASQLPTLTQKVAAASCAVTSGVAVTVARDALTEATSQFDQFVVALRDGDPTLNVFSPESDRRVLGGLDQVAAAWQPVHTAVETVLSDESDAKQANVIQDHSDALLVLTNTVAADVAGVHARPFQMAYDDAMLLKLAGRQHMLSQKMAKDACDIWSDVNVEARRGELAASMEMFENTLIALRHGMPDLGIPAAPNEDIAEDLDQLIDRWQEMQVMLRALIDGNEISLSQKSAIYQAALLDMEEIDTLLADYRAHSERAH